MTTRPRRPITIAVTTAAVIAVAVTAWVAARGDEATVEAGAASAENVARTTTTDAAPCPGLRSETAWTGSDDGSTLTAAAGSWAELSETVTNGPEPCELVSNRCGALARLLHPNGDRVETDDRACDLAATMLELDPHEVATEELRVPVPVPPGEYVLRVDRYDGTSVDIPARFDDDVPPCRSQHMKLFGSSPGHTGPTEPEQGVDPARGYVGVSLMTTQDECTMRIVRLRLEVDVVGEVATFVDERPRWVSTDGFPGTDTDGRFGSMDLPSGRYASTVIVELADGSSVSSPLDLVVF